MSFSKIISLRSSTVVSTKGICDQIKKIIKNIYTDGLPSYRVNWKKHLSILDIIMISSVFFSSRIMGERLQHRCCWQRCKIMRQLKLKLLKSIFAHYIYLWCIPKFHFMVIMNLWEISILSLFAWEC